MGSTRIPPTVGTRGHRGGPGRIFCGGARAFVSIMMWQCSLMARIDMEEGAVMWCVYVNGRCNENVQIMYSYQWCLYVKPLDR
jgi:hypothetical protein